MPVTFADSINAVYDRRLKKYTEQPIERLVQQPSFEDSIDAVYDRRMRKYELPEQPIVTPQIALPSVPVAKPESTRVFEPAIPTLPVTAEPSVEQFAELPVTPSEPAQPIADWPPPEQIIPGIEKISEIRQAPPAGAREAIRNVRADMMRFMPYLHDVKEFEEVATVTMSIMRLKEGKESQADLELLKNYLEREDLDARREKTFWYGAIDGITRLPAYMGEFALTSPLYTFGKKAAMTGAKKVARKQIQKLLRSKLGKLGLKSAVGIAGATVQAPAIGIVRVPTDFIKRTMPDITVSEDEYGKLKAVIEGKGEDVLPAMYKALGSNWVEVVSEHSGMLFAGIPNSAKNLAVKAGLISSMRKVNPSKSLKQIVNLFDKAGYHGIIGEIGEERLGEIGRAALGIEDYRLPTGKQLMQELVIFSVPGAVKSTAGLALRPEVEPVVTPKPPTPPPAEIEPAIKPVPEPTSLPVTKPVPEIVGKPKAPVEVELTPEGVQITPTIPESKAQKLTFRQQYDYLLSEIDTAIEATQYETHDFGEPELEGKVSIEVPDDGVFTVWNNKESLNKFRELVSKKFPKAKTTRLAKAKPPKAEPKLKPLGKRIKGDYGSPVEYYNQFRPRKQDIITGWGESNIYQDGYYSTGEYMVMTDKKPTIKTRKGYYRDVDKGTIKNIIDEVESVSSELVGEFYTFDMIDYLNPALAHIVTKNNEHYKLDAHLVDAILTKYPDAKTSTVTTEIGEKTDAMPGLTLFTVGKERVGLVMPLKDTDVEHPSGAIKNLDDIVVKRYPEVIGKEIVPSEPLLPAEALPVKKPTTPIIEEPVAEKVEKVKEPWQMTQGNYVNDTIKALKFSEHEKAIMPYSEDVFGRPVTYGEMADYKAVEKRLGYEHKELVQNALSEGKPIPTEVLKDYPELAKPPVKKLTPPVAKKPEVPVTEVPPVKAPPAEKPIAKPVKPELKPAVPKYSELVRDPDTKFTSAKVQSGTHLLNINNTSWLVESIDKPSQMPNDWTYHVKNEVTGQTLKRSLNALRKTHRIIPEVKPIKIVKLAKLAPEVEEEMLAIEKPSNQPSSTEQKSKVHQIQRKLKMSDEEYRNLAYQTTGKISTTQMNVEEVTKFTDTLKKEPVVETPSHDELVAEIESRPIKEPDTVEEVEVEKFEGWPKSIKKVGQDYWTEVMATSKRLMTKYRYKNMRTGVLGSFNPKAGIKLRDIKDALTATHELGHDIDWLLNNKNFPRSIKLRFPDTQVGEKLLRDELKAISKIIRPDIWKKSEKRPATMRYLSKHTELMADYVTNYILNPEKTRELAPNITTIFERDIADQPEIFHAINTLQLNRYEGPTPTYISQHISDVVPEGYDPLQLTEEVTDESYDKVADRLGLRRERHHKIMVYRGKEQAKRIDKLVPNKDRQTDLVIVVENAPKNPWTDEMLAEIKKKGLTANERKAINIYHGYMELGRQTINKYLRGSNIPEYIKFLEDYFIHTYDTPMTQKRRNFIANWAKKSPQARHRVIPDLATAVEWGFSPRVKTLSDGLLAWTGINARVATNISVLKALPQIVNDDGMSIIQKPGTEDTETWPTVDYWPIRQTYKIPLKERGILLFQGRVAVDPKVKPLIDSLFGQRIFNTPMYALERLNATAKAFELTLFSLFHHQAEFFSATGSFGWRAIPYVGGFYGRKAEMFGKKKLMGVLPAHIKLLQAGKQLADTPEIVEMAIDEGIVLGKITTEGIAEMEKMLIAIETRLKILMEKQTGIKRLALWTPYIQAKTIRAVYSKNQDLLWDNVERAKILTWYYGKLDGLEAMDKLRDKISRLEEKDPDSKKAKQLKKQLLSPKEIGETVSGYSNDDFGGQEWQNTIFKNPIVRQIFTQLMMSLDWTYSQIKTGAKTIYYGGDTAHERARRAFVRKMYRKHWFKYLSAVAITTIAANFALTRKWPWENEIGHKFDVDWTNTWRKLPWNSGAIGRSWEERGDTSRRYIALGKAGRELWRWVSEPKRALGYKSSPAVRKTLEQWTGTDVSGEFPMPWTDEDLVGYERTYKRFISFMEIYKPFAFSGNNAFLAFPSRKGMTNWKANASYRDLYRARAHIAMGKSSSYYAKVKAQWTKIDRQLHIVGKNEKQLRKDIETACKLNNVDAKKADKYALIRVRGEYIGKMVSASKRQDVKKMETIKYALIELGYTEEGFWRTLENLGDTISPETRKLLIDVARKQPLK